MMSNYDSMYSSMTESMTSRASVSPVNKLPLKRVEPTIQRFTKIALPTDLERLLQHKKMIIRYKEQEDWEKLNTEQVNARLTVQQLKANIREMDKARCQIRDEDLPALDARVNPLKEEAVRAIASFIEECGLEVLTHNMMNGVHQVSGNGVPQVSGGAANQHTSEVDDEDAEVLVVDEEDQVQSQIDENERLQQKLEETRLAEESWNRLRGDMEDVASIIQDFAEQVQNQKEVTDRIEENIDKAHAGVLQGTKDMIRSAKLKNVVLPLTGALVGTAVGGPIGLMVGYKVGAAAAFGGGALGLISARIFKRRADARNDADLDRLEGDEQQKGTDELEADTTDR